MLSLTNHKRLSILGKFDSEFYQAVKDDLQGPHVNKGS